jgi:hydroxyacylglutathione hydrolase
MVLTCKINEIKWPAGAMYLLFVVFNKKIIFFVGENIHPFKTTFMLNIKIFPFNPFQVNTYVLYDETGECVIIDASCYEAYEEKLLKNYISENNLKPVALLTTHCHIDHILGNNFIADTYNLKPQIHHDGKHFLENAMEYAETFGFRIKKPVMPEEYLKDGQVIKFGNQSITVLETPGHASGSVCFYHQEEKFVIAGDVLFQNSIGRTDLPTGDYDTLIKSINEKLMTLEDDVKVYSGHGPATEIGYERRSNPYLNGIY